MKTKELLTKLHNTPENVNFKEVIATIDAEYSYIPCRFFNGVGDDRINNEAASNEGSCKIFAFAKMHHLKAHETLHCFGDYYRTDVLQNPKGADHANIRTFIRHGWDGIEFDGIALTKEKSD